MLDPESIEILKIIREAVGAIVDIDTATALTTILNHKLITINELCFDGITDFRTPLDMTLRYSCEIVCELQIAGTRLPIINYNAWMTIWGEEYYRLYKTQGFQELVQKTIEQLAAHPCVDSIKES